MFGRASIVRLRWLAMLVLVAGVSAVLGRHVVPAKANGICDATVYPDGCFAPGNVTAQPFATKVTLRWQYGPDLPTDAYIAKASNDDARFPASWTSPWMNIADFTEGRPTTFDDPDVKPGDHYFYTVCFDYNNYSPYNGENYNVCTGATPAPVGIPGSNGGGGSGGNNGGGSGGTGGTGGDGGGGYVHTPCDNDPNCPERPVFYWPPELHSWDDAGQVYHLNVHVNQPWAGLPKSGFNGVHIARYFGWNNPADPGVDESWTDPGPGPYFDNIAQPSARELYLGTLTDVTVTYTYQVCNLFAGYDPQTFCATTSQITMPHAPAAAPNNLTVQTTGPTTAVLTWAAATGDTWFQVERCQNTFTKPCNVSVPPNDSLGGMGGFVSAQLGAAVTSYTDTILPNQSYYYRVCAGNDASEAPWDVLTGTYAARACTDVASGQSEVTPDAPAQLKAHLVAGPAVQLSWQLGKVPGYSLELYRQNDGVTTPSGWTGFVDAPIAMLDPLSATSYIDTTVVSGPHYAYRVCALSETDLEACSTVAGVDGGSTPPTGSLLTPAVPVVQVQAYRDAKSPTTIHVSWRDAGPIAGALVIAQGTPPPPVSLTGGKLQWTTVATLSSPGSTTSYTYTQTGALAAESRPYVVICVVKSGVRSGALGGGSESACSTPAPITATQQPIAH